MSTIIAGGFEDIEYGNRALGRLQQSGVPTGYICTYRVNSLRPFLGSAGIAAGVGVGAYAGSLVGGLEGTDEEPQPGHEDLPPAEILVAVNADAAGVEDHVIVKIFEECGAWRVERADGRWADGVWADFDPLTRPRLIGGRDRFDARPAGENSKRA